MGQFQLSSSTNANASKRSSAVMLAAFLCACVANAAIAQEAAAPALTTARALRELDPQEAKGERPVHLRATVTFVDASHTVFVQDDTGGTFIRGQASFSEMRPGMILEIDGVSYPGLYVPGIGRRNVRIIG